MKPVSMLAGSGLLLMGNATAQTTSRETGPLISPFGETEALRMGGTRRSRRVRLAMIGAVLALLFSASLALSPGAEAHIYWSTGSSIGRANLDGTGVDEDFITGTCGSFGLAVDDSYLYWVNAECHSIGRANTDGTGTDQDFITGLDLAGSYPAKPGGLAIDAASIYWYMAGVAPWNNTYGATNIGHANIDGSGAEEQFWMIGFIPAIGQGVAVDNAHIYFAGNSTIGRRNLDGSGYNGQFIYLGYAPLQIAVDGEHIYWTALFLNSIGRANLDGTGVNQNFITGAGAPAGIVVGNGHIYWTNGTSIARANLDGTEVDLNFITGVFANASLALDPPHVPDYMILGCDPPEVATWSSSKCIADVLDQSGDGIPATGTVSFTTNGGTLSASTCRLNIYSYCGVDWYPPANGVPGSSYWIKAHYNGDRTFLPGDFPYPAWVQIVAAGGSAPPPPSPPTWRERVLHELLRRSPEAFAEALIGNLEANGFQVSEGSAELYTLDDCIERTYPAMKNCFQANPAAPYVGLVVKSWPDEYVDPATVNAFVETDPGYSATYRLDPREAIVIYGEMPPPGRYMGLQTWEFSEQGKWSPDDYNEWASTPDLPFPMQYLFQTVPPDDPKSQRIITFSALGDVVNNVVMERQSGEYPFGEIRYFIITPSPETDRAVRRALQALGVADHHILTEQIPGRDEYGPVGPLGMGKSAIDFLSVFRYAVPNPGYEKAAAEWRADLPFTVLRVRASSSPGPVQRYGSLTFEPRTANSEAYLAGDLDDLVAAVCDRLGSHGFTSADCAQPPPASSFMSDLTSDYGWTGPYCRDIGMNCQGDQQEAAYPFSSARSLDTGEVFAVVGTLATETGNATYVGLSANDLSMMAGVANALDTDLKDSEGNVVIKGLRGSAGSYASTVENTDKFFVYYFAWDCALLAGVPGGNNCAPLPADLLPPDEGDPALRGTFTIGLRDYVAPGTQRGPDFTKLLTPRIFTFTPPVNFQ